MLIQVGTYIAYGLVGVAILTFLLLAWRDLLRLVKSPKGLGPGWGRIWALARTSIAEAVSTKAWLMPVLWMMVCGAMIVLVRTHGDDERERMSLYLTILIRGQEYLLLVLMLVLACFSLPRERERKTIITTGSKPISRLEFYLGKVVGFSTFAALLLVVMCGLSYATLLVADQFGKARSWENYQARQADYDKKLPGAGVPPEGLRLDAERGVLQAGNFVTPRKGGMQIAGMIEYRGEETIRYLKGGSAERVFVRFSSLWRELGKPNPFFLFRFGVRPILEGSPYPEKIQLQLVLSAENNPSQGGIREHTVELLPIPDQAGVYATSWSPDPEGLLSYFETDGKGNVTLQRDYGRVQVEMRCPTPGVYLEIREIKDANDSNILALGLGREPSTMGPLSSPYMMGFEKRDMQQIEGPPENIAPQAVETMSTEQINFYCAQLEVASWRFKQADLQAGQVPVNPDGTVTLSMFLDVEKMKNYVTPTAAAINVYNQLGQDQGKMQTVVIAEKRLTEIKVPLEVINKGGDLFVDIRCLTPGHWIGGNDLSLRLAQPDSPFIWNLMKSELVIFLEVTLLIVVAVAASIRLGGPVAMLVTFVVYLLGNLFVFVNDTVLNGANSLLSATDQRDLAGNWLYMASEVIYNLGLKILLVIVKILPDFRIFDPLDYLVMWRNMPILHLVYIMAGTFVYALPFIALAYLLFRKQEIS